MLKLFCNILRWYIANSIIVSIILIVIIANSISVSIIALLL